MTVKLYRNARIFTPLDPGCPLEGQRAGKIKEYGRGAILAVNGLEQRPGERKNEVLLPAGLSSTPFGQ